MKMAKAFAVLAAVFLVSAVAVGTLGPVDMSLGEGLSALDKARVADVERFVRTHISGWLWDHPLKALFGRPVWLLPASIGLVLVGASCTAATRGNPLNTRRRRS